MEERERLGDLREVSFGSKKKKRRSEEKDKEKGGQMLVDETVNIA